MDLIIKPTEVCNFACTFCSSTNISEDKKQILPLQYIKDFLKRFPDTRTIIVNGGDPLVIQPDYYWELINYLDDNKYPAIISFTTNLWDFYKYPEKWVNIFKRKEFKTKHFIVIMKFLQHSFSVYL